MGRRDTSTGFARARASRAQHANSSNTLSARATPDRSFAHSMAGLPDDTRAAMAHIAASLPVDEALEPVIALLLEGSAARAAAADAFRTNPALRDQWRRAHEMLRREGGA